MEPIDEEFFQLHHIEYVDIIGRGGYGVIFKVFSPHYQQHFALKRIPAEKFDSSEVECMIAINSSSIVPLYHYYYFNEYVYLLMEYCPGSVDKLVVSSRQSSEPLSLDKIYYIAHGMASSLSECHHKEIIHGDVKPSNFLIDKYGRIKICDFGLSHKKIIGQNDSKYAGTLLYLAPEVLMRKPYDAYKEKFNTAVDLLNSRCPAIETTIPKQFLAYFSDYAKSLTEIGQNAFMNCINLYQINIPSTVQSVGPSAFLGCYNLQCGLKIENNSTSFRSSLVTVSKIPQRCIKQCISQCTENKGEIQLTTTYVFIILPCFGIF